MLQQNKHMAEINQNTTTLLDDFQALPEAIKNWLASDHTTTAIAEINKKLGIKEARRSIIPGLVLRLIVRDLEPQDFINELSEELKINYPTAKALTEEIESKILKPIETGLSQDVGVDVKLIYSAPAAPLQEASLAPSGQEISPAPMLKPSQIVPPQSQAQVKKEAVPEQPGIAPRLLYKERTLGANPLPAVALRESESETEQSPVTIKPASFRLGIKETIPVRTAAIHSDLAEKFFQQENLGPANQARVVHYSGPVTPFNSFSLEEKNDLDSFVVDLRTI